MLNFELPLILFYITGMIMVTYKSYALSQDWKRGGLLNSDKAAVRTLGALFLFGSAVIAFFIFKWYWVYFSLISGGILSFIILSVFKKGSKWVSLTLFLLGMILLTLSIK